jgi:hypothetical protein
MFTGNENQEISLSDASQITSEYRSQFPGDTLGHYFGRTILEKILEQDACVGIRVYYGINPEDGSKELIIAGVDANENDLYGGVLGDRSFKSPPFSGASNPLNS